MRVTSPLQLVAQFCQNGPIRAQDVGDFARPPSCFLLYALQVAKKAANVWHPLCNLQGFSFVIVALQEKLPRVRWPLGLDGKYFGFPYGIDRCHYIF